MHRLATVLAAAFVALAPLPATAQTIEAIEAADQALGAVWDATPLAFRKVLYVSEVIGYGAYTEHSGTSFKSGEQIITYAEPVGYGYKANADGTYVLGFRVDVTIKAPGGEIVLEQKDFATLEMTSHVKNREFMLTLTLDISGAPVGDYVLEYLVHDLGSDETAPISRPFAIVE